MEGNTWSPRRKKGRESATQAISVLNINIKKFKIPTASKICIDHRDVHSNKTHKTVHAYQIETMSTIMQVEEALEMFVHISSTPTCSIAQGHTIHECSQSLIHLCDGPQEPLWDLTHSFKAKGNFHRILTTHF